jgi:hypothetical protein
MIWWFKAALLHVILSAIQVLVRWGRALKKNLGETR